MQLVKSKSKENWVLFLGLPALVLWLVFMCFPAIWAIVVSFTNEALVGKAAANPRWVGFDNYIKLLKDSYFLNSITKSFIYVLGSAVIGQLGLGLLLAVLTRRRRRKKDEPPLLGPIATTVCYLGWISPAAVVGFMWLSTLDVEGSLNQLLHLNFTWIVDFPMISIIVINMWWGTGWSMTLMKSAIETIPPEIEECAEVDGANKRQVFYHIILPIIKGPILVNLILITIWTYGVFDVPFMVTAGGPGRKTELMTIFAYLTGFKYFDIGYGVTISVGILVITLVLSLVYQQFLKKGG